MALGAAETAAGVVSSNSRSALREGRQGVQECGLHPDESWVFGKNRYVIGDVESGGTCQLAKLASDTGNGLARPGG